jgi:hypothetical protein
MNTPTQLVTAAVVASVLMAGAPARAVDLHPGDLVLVQTEYPSEPGLVFRLDPVTLEPTPIGSGALVQGASGIAVDHQGRIVIANGAGLVTIDAHTASVTPLVGTAALGGNPGGVCVTPSGDLFVSVSGGVAAAIVRVSPQGGVTTVTTAGSLQSPQGLVLGPDGALYVTEMALPANNGLTPFGSTSHGSIVRVDPVSGTQTRIAADPLFVGPFAILFNGPHEIWTAQEGYTVAGREGCFVRTQLSNGTSDRNVTTSCRSHGMVVAADGGVVLSDCSTIGPDCYTPYTTRYPGGVTLSGYGGLLALVPADVVPVRHTSWGSLKTIYR